MSSSERKCQFCGTTSGLNVVQEADALICNKCWEAIAGLFRRMLQSLSQQLATYLQKPFTEE